MTANLSSFLRFKYGGKPGGSGSASALNEEQDLGGFSDVGGMSVAARAAREAVDKNYGMGTIQEGADEESPGKRLA